MLYGGIHYIFDTAVKLYTYGPTIVFQEDCKCWYTVHHLFTFI